MDSSVVPVCWMSKRSSSELMLTWACWKCLDDSPICPEVLCTTDSGDPDGKDESKSDIWIFSAAVLITNLSIETLTHFLPPHAPKNYTQVSGAWSSLKINQQPILLRYIPTDWLSSSVRTFGGLALTPLLLGKSTPKNSVHQLYRLKSTTRGH